MKGRLIAFLAAGGILLLVALYNGEQLFYMLFIAIVLVFLVSLVSLFMAVQSFSYSQSLSNESAVKGDTVEMVVEIHNDHHIPFALVELEYDTPASSYGSDAVRRTFSLMPRENIKYTEKIACRYRGFWPVGLRKVYFYDLFGLFKVPVRFENISGFRSISLMVYPRIIPLEHLPLPQYQNEGAMLMRAKQTPDINQYSDMRKYATGDPMKKIHWKLTARQRELMVKNYEHDALPNTLLYLDSSAHNLSGIEAIILEDTMVECATAIAYYILSHWLPLQIITYTNKRVVLSESRPDNFAEIHRFLAEIRFESDFLMTDILGAELSGVGQNGCLFMIMHNLDQKTFAQLIRLREASMLITLMLVSSPQASGNPEHTLMISELIDAGVTVIELKSGESLEQKLEAML